MRSTISVDINSIFCIRSFLPFWFDTIQYQYHFTISMIFSLFFSFRVWCEFYMSTRIEHTVCLQWHINKYTQIFRSQHKNTYQRWKKLNEQFQDLFRTHIHIYEGEHIRTKEMSTFDEIQFFSSVQHRMCIHTKFTSSSKEKREREKTNTVDAHS